MEDYKEVVDTVYAAVKDIPQELQLKAFEILLLRALNQQDGTAPIPNMAGVNQSYTPAAIPTPAITNGLPANGVPANGNGSINKKGLEALAVEIGVSVETLTDFIIVDEAKKEIKLRMHLNNPVDRDNHVVATLVYIAAKKYAFGDETASSYELGETVKMMGLRSLSNFVANVNTVNTKSERAMFVVSGVKGGKKTYRITEFGLLKAREALKKYVTGE